MFDVYTVYTRPLSAQAQYSRSYSIICSLRYNSSLDSWTVICWQPPSLSLLCFLCWASLCPQWQRHLRCVVYLVARILGLLAQMFCQSQSYIMNNSQSASPSRCQEPIWDPRPIWQTSFFFLDSYMFVDVERPLCWEDGSVICSAMTQVHLDVHTWPFFVQLTWGSGSPFIEHVSCSWSPSLTVKSWSFRVNSGLHISESSGGTKMK
jgi:hypothetical protein